MKKSQLVAAARALLVVGAFAVVQAQPAPVQLITITADGFQANSTSPLILRGDLIGDGAVWHRLAGPFLSSPFAMIPGAGANFTGATCQAEYGQDEIVARDGSTLTGVVYGLCCEPSPTTGAHITTGTYSIQSGTGRFQGFIGAGTISFDARADGSTLVHIGGTIRRVCSGGACGS
jgi:hypothetical protein